MIATTTTAILPALVMAASVAEKNSNLPILSHVLITASEGTLTFTASDSQQELSATVAVDATEAAQFCCGAKKMVDVIKGLPKGADVAIRYTGANVVLNCGKSQFSLAALDGIDYPRMAAEAPHFSFTMAGEHLRRGLEFVKPAIAIDDARFFLNGALMEVEASAPVLASTDGHRLAVFSFPEPVNTQPFRIIIPRKAVLQLQKMLPNTEITVSIGDSYASFRWLDSVLTTKLIDGKFPEFRRVIPTPPYRASVTRIGLVHALQSVAAISSAKYVGVKITFSRNKLTLDVVNETQETAITEISEVMYSGAETVIGFNVDYLIDALSVLSAETVEIDFTDLTSSAILQSPESSSMQIVMPMRL